MSSIWETSVPNSPTTDPLIAGETPPPLQYVSLFGESLPQNGTVPLSKLTSILSKTGISGPDVTSILDNVTKTSGNRVSESQFYIALAQAANVQRGHPPSTSSNSQLEMQNLEFAGEVEYREVQKLEYIIQQQSIQVKVCNKQAGSFLSKFTTYTVAGVLDSQMLNLTKRFSDFYALRDELVSLYPFRLIPLLPPKILSLGGRYLTNEDQDNFLAKRAMALARFVNLVAQHPVLCKSKPVLVFLGLDTHTPGSAKCEVDLLPPSPEFVSQFSEEIEDKWTSIELACRNVQGDISSMCVALERVTKRMEAELVERTIFSRNCLSISRNLPKLYPNQSDSANNNNDLDQIQVKLSALGSFAKETVDQNTLSLAVFKFEPLEQLKVYREMLNSVLDTFRRVETLGSNTIKDQEKLIVNSNHKIEQLQANGNNLEEIQKLKQIIITAQEDIKQQTAKKWNMRIILTEELNMAEGMQYQISLFLHKLASSMSEGNSKYSDLLTQTCDEISSAPSQV